MTHQEIIQSYDKQMNVIRNQLMTGDFSNAVDNTVLLGNWIKVKISEIGEENKNG